MLMKAGLALIYLFLLMYLEASYDEKLFDVSLERAVEEQKDAPSSETTWWLIYNNLGLTIISS